MVILTVEDEFLISEYLRAILEGGGHTVIATLDADEAIKVLERVRDIQLVITDVDMPGSMDGLRLAAAIRDRGRCRGPALRDLCCLGPMVSAIATRREFSPKQ
jgi:CheY-like chemotaxis protein